MIDPLDGTTNFLQGLPVWAVSIACRRGDETLAAVVLDPCSAIGSRRRRGGGAFWNGRPMSVSAARASTAPSSPPAIRSAPRRRSTLYLELFRDIFPSARAIRRCGAAALDLAYVAAGVYDGFFEFRLSPWDIAAGALLIREAGGVVTDFDGGSRHLTSGNVLAGSPGVHRGLLEVTRRHIDEATVDRLVP